MAGQVAARLSENSSAGYLCRGTLCHAPHYERSMQALKKLAIVRGDPELGLKELKFDLIKDTF